jgi:hypothetical protein
MFTALCFFNPSVRFPHRSPLLRRAKTPSRQVWHGVYAGGGENRTLGSNSGCTRPSDAAEGIASAAHSGSGDSLASSGRNGIAFYIP